MLIADIADKVVIRKLHVLSALDSERHRKRAMDNATQTATTGVNGTAGGGNIAHTTAVTPYILTMSAC